MIKYLYLLLALSTGATQQFFKKPYASRFDRKGVHLFNSFATAAAALFFILSAGGLQWVPAILPYVLLFAASYACSTLFTMLAIGSGPLSLTALLINFSTIIPVVYGILTGEPIKYALFLPGLVLFILCLLFTNKPEKGQKLSGKWLFFVCMAALGNGGCMIFQTMQQVEFEQQYGNELMGYSLILVCLLFFTISFFTERKNWKTYLRGGAYGGACAGFLNGGHNLTVMLSRPLFGAAVVFPLIAGGGLVLTYLVSLFFFKEKLHRWQVIGFFLGLASVILLSI